MSAAPATGCRQEIRADSSQPSKDSREQHVQKTGRRLRPEAEASNDVANTSSEVPNSSSPAPGRFSNIRYRGSNREASDTPDTSREARGCLAIDGSKGKRKCSGLAVSSDEGPEATRPKTK
jgi:hypothetical protein